MRLTKRLCTNAPFAFLLASNSVWAAQKAPPAALAPTTFAELLKVPLDHPKVSVTVRNTKQEDDLIIEDIVWESLDGEHPIAYVVRPAKAQGKLPAVVCLYGTTKARHAQCSGHLRRRSTGVRVRVNLIPLAIATPGDLHGPFSSIAALQSKPEGQSCY